MKKKLYFDETVNLDPDELFIFIFNGKVREYHGYNLTSGFIAAVIPDVKLDKNDLDFKVFEFNAEFRLIKIGKYDRKKHGINANYKIDCRELFEKTLKDLYIRLNVFEKFKIDYDKGESILHRMKFREKLIYFLIFSIPSMVFGYYLNNWTKKTPESNNIFIDKNIAKPDSIPKQSFQEIENSRLSDSTINTNKYHKD